MGRMVAQRGNLTIFVEYPCNQTVYIIRNHIDGLYDALDHPLFTDLNKAIAWADNYNKNRE